jgi:hypothetical protein
LKGSIQDFLYITQQLPVGTAGNSNSPLSEGSDFFPSKRLPTKYTLLPNAIPVSPYGFPKLEDVSWKCTALPELIFEEVTNLNS